VGRVDLSWGKKSGLLTNKEATIINNRVEGSTYGENTTSNGTQLGEEVTERRPRSGDFHL